MTKISVIVPTYCSGEGLDRVLGSLDAQTLPQSDFETVFVDDGSPDGTHERLLRLAATRPNMRVTAIENSGWPSRPRNVGLEMAEGEYVLFMDHDDEVFPEALERAYDFAVTHDLDVVNGRETKTTRRFFGWPAYQQDLYPPVDKVPRLIMPMTPHKLYRRKFLLDHGIRFREGRRVQWEDIYFNIDVYAHTDRLGVLASTPVYHWVTGTGTNSSGSYAASGTAFLDHLASVFEHIEASALDERSKTFLKAHHYGHRVLHAMVGPGVLGRDEEYQRAVMERVPELVDKHVPVSVDRELDGLDRTRSALLRAGRLDLLLGLAEHDDAVRTEVRAESVSLDDQGHLVITSESRWFDGDGGELVFRKAGDRLYRPAPDEVVSALAPEHLDVTGDVHEATASHYITTRRENVAWALPTQAAVRLEEDGDQVRVVVRATTVFDLDTAALGNRIHDGVWEVGMRPSLIGFAGLPRVFFSGDPRCSVAGDTVVTARSGARGRLVLDVGERKRSVFAATDVDVTAAEVSRTGLRGSRIRVPVTGIAGTSDSQREIRVLFRLADGAGEPVGVPGWLRFGPAGSWLEVDCRLPSGTYDVAVRRRPEDRLWEAPLRVRVTALGRCSVEARALPKKQDHVWRAES